MNFIKLGKRYINLDAIAAIVPCKKGLGYTVSFIDGKAMDICEMDMADIRRILEASTVEKAAIDEANIIFNNSSHEDMLDWIKHNLSKETEK